jgi:hypothetical protein
MIKRSKHICFFSRRRRQNLNLDKQKKMRTKLRTKISSQPRLLFSRTYNINNLFDSRLQFMSNSLNPNRNKRLQFMSNSLNPNNNKRLQFMSNSLNPNRNNRLQFMSNSLYPNRNNQDPDPQSLQGTKLL